MYQEMNNKAEILGTVHSEITYSHSVYEERFYTFMMKVDRLSNIADYINVTVSEYLLQLADVSIGRTMSITGQFRSYNNYSGCGNKLQLTVFAKKITNIEGYEDNQNSILINGFICKEPVFRVTPFGREITDLLVAVNRTYNKSDYIPCIAWGQNSRYAGTMPIGTNVIIEGRIQSRNYQKKISEEEVIAKTAYEVSVTKIEIVIDGVHTR